jgi:hypothetical protein
MTTKGIEQMNTTGTQGVHPAFSRWLAGEAAGRSIAEGLGAIAAVILAVIGLAGILPNLMASIAAIVIGAGILVEGWAVGFSYHQSSSGGAASGEGMGVNGVLTADFLGGMAGIVLGILALFRMVPDTLLAVALLVYGATLLLSSIGASQTFWLMHSLAQSGARTETPGATPAVHSGQLLVGLGAVVLGILAVIGLLPMTLVLVGLLSLAAVMLLGQFRLP